MNRYSPALLALVGYAATLGMASCGSDVETTALPPVDAATPPGVTCTPGETCTIGHCTLEVPTSVTVPAGGTILLAEQSARAELSADVLVPYVCAVSIPDGAAATPMRLLLASDATLNDAVIFRDDVVPSAVAGSAATERQLVGLVNASGSYGATQAPKPWALSSTVDNDPLSSADTPSLIRNLTSQTISSAFYDGARLFVGSGPRVLVYDGIPSTAATKPALVVGQASLDGFGAVPSSAVFAGGVNAIWSDKSKLVVAESSRVLVWNTSPTQSFQPADVVLGQSDFVTLASNAGGLSASTLSTPRGVDSDGTRLAVADTLNHRVLTWDAFPTRIGQPASSVLGQPSFTTNEIRTIYQPSGVSLAGGGAFVATAFTGTVHFPSFATNTPSDFAPVPAEGVIRVRANSNYGSNSVAPLSGGGLAMTTTLAPRICIQRSTPTSASACDFALGQPDANRVAGTSITSSTFSFAAKVFTKDGGLLVSDGARVLVYDHVPAYNFDPADRVVGQAGFSVNDASTDYRRISASTLGYPADVAVAANRVAVADRGNNRVLLYPSLELAGANAAASVVVGQSNAVGFAANGEQGAATASTLSGPGGVAITATHLFVADTENHRVLVWTPVPTTSGTPATFVLGQADFAGHRPNRGRNDSNLDGYSDASADGLFSPTGVVTDGTRLFVADRMNHRVVVWSSIAGLSNGRAADRVIGQPDFGAVGPNAGSGLFPRANSLYLPTGLTLDGTSLWIADSENNRVVRWDDVTTAPAPAAVLGQSDLTALDNANTHPDSSANAGLPVTPPTTAASVLRPRGVAVAGNRVFVSERDSNRVHVFRRDGAGYVHDGLFGQAVATSANVNAAGGVSASSLSSPEGIFAAGGSLFVADSSNHRVLVLDAAAPVAATKVLGQPSVSSNGFNQALAVSAGGTTNARGLALANGELFMAERSRNRVLERSLPLVSGKAPLRILGQTDLGISQPNGGGVPSASTLSAPMGVYVDDARIIVADSGNNRVLIYPRDGLTAGVVLGQTSFDAVAPNFGGGAHDNTMNAPSAVHYDGTRLYVADTGNHRVLVWDSLPILSGTPANIVIGQSSFDAILPNRGAGAADGTTLASPGAVLVANGVLFVSDTGNNRVMAFDLPLRSSAPLAARIVGQPDASGRTPAASILDASRLAGPVALATDGTSLFVGDRDMNRVVRYLLSNMDTGAAAAELFNANNGLSAAPAALAVERTPFFTTRLYVADSTRDRILVADGISRLR